MHYETLCHNFMSVLCVAILFFFLFVHRSVQHLPLGDWVRVKSGIYAGDLGQAMDHDAQTDVVTVRLIPRVDFNEAIERVCNMRILPISYLCHYFTTTLST